MLGATGQAWWRWPLVLFGGALVVCTADLLQTGVPRHAVIEDSWGPARSDTFAFVPPPEVMAMRGTR